MRFGRFLSNSVFMFNIDSWWVEAPGRATLSETEDSNASAAGNVLGMNEFSHRRDCYSFSTQLKV